MTPQVKVFEITSDKLKAVKPILEGPDKKDPATGKWIINEWVTRGYKLNDARGLGLEGANYFLYVKADDAFFKKNERAILDAGAKELQGPEYEKVKRKFEDAAESAEAGLGAIFG
jgi:hypothetical protein